MMTTAAPLALLDCLKIEAEALQALLHQLRRQQQALVSGDQTVIQASSQEAEQLIPRLQTATQARLAAQQDFDSLEQALEGIVSLREQMQFKVCLQTLRQGAEELGLLQKRNAALIAQGISWVDATLTTFVQLQQNGQPAVYSASGGEAADWNPERSLCDFNA